MIIDGMKSFLIVLFLISSLPVTDKTVGGGYCHLQRRLLVFLYFIQDLALMMTKESGVSHAAVMVEADTSYNLISTDPDQAFSAYLYTTHQQIEDYQYTKGVNIGHRCELILLCDLQRQCKSSL